MKTQLKHAPTQEAAFNEWFNGGPSGSISCRYSQVWPFPSGYPWNPSTDGYGGECQPLNPLPGNIGGCVPGMTLRDNVPYAINPPGAGIIGSAPGGVLDISANAEEFGLDQYTWAIVT